MIKTSIFNYTEELNGTELEVLINEYGLTIPVADKDSAKKLAQTILEQSQKESTR
jgi:hypothetical protein